MVKIIELGTKNSIINNFIAELRDVNIQNDRMRFRRNLERIGEAMALEISKSLEYKDVTITTPLGEKKMSLIAEQPVIGTIMRAGLPLHQGFLNVFDKADNVFIAAYRKYDKNEDFEIRVEYYSAATINERTLILVDPMLATGASIVNCLNGLVNEAHKNPYRRSDSKQRRHRAYQKMPLKLRHHSLDRKHRRRADITSLHRPRTR